MTKRLPAETPTRWDHLYSTFEVDGGRGWQYNDLIRIQVGRVLHVIQYMSYTTAPDRAVLAEIADSVVAHTG